jgi:hypothetical protein
MVGVELGFVLGCSRKDQNIEHQLNGAFVTFNRLKLVLNLGPLQRPPKHLETLIT